MVALCKEWGAVPPYNLELVTLKPNPTPANRDLITAYISRQCAIGNPELRAWLTQRRDAYIGMSAGTWDTSLITYAVAHHAAMPASSRIRAVQMETRQSRSCAAGVLTQPSTSAPVARPLAT